ncbi:glycosyltransferase [Streptomyces sp. RKND-216]|uniref:macrolide family glycosyltransferase n=1 Tax=Streptomyces sp. RKND-216 TaxID=2562581 RepID=UPI00109DA9B7|nr:macrolide family glycosyltransferase [Streptomyces sp. RKND-216]THA23711.1 glycosyltransferase [Streptomyces sp. RKND-216]
MSAYHVAFMPLPEFGHVSPTLPIVEELVRRGHRVTFATTRRFEEKVTAAGARALCYESWLTSRKLPDTMDAEYMVHEPVRSIDEGIATVPVLEEGFGDDIPDVLLYDVSTFAAGRVLARKWKRPAIEMFGTLASNDTYSLTQQIGSLFADEIDPHHPALIDFFVKQGQLLKDHGLAHVTLEEFNAPADESNLVFLPRSFQPAHETFDERFAFVGPSVGSRDDEPDWEEPEPGRPVALVSRGSMQIDGQAAILRTYIEAFAGTDWHVVVAAADHVDRDELGSVPDNVRLMSWVPQLSVLRRADVFVSHGGTNSVMEAMYLGTPVVAVPYTPEQHFIAERLAELGLGAHLPQDEVTPERLRTEAERLVADESVLAGVRALQREMHAVDGPAQAADRVEAAARG